jgi:hypothetical protein
MDCGYILIDLRLEFTYSDYGSRERSYNMGVVNGGDPFYVDKWNNYKLSKAINSIFRWYPNLANTRIPVSCITVVLSREYNQHTPQHGATDILLDMKSNASIRQGTEL